jgi:acyl-CoA synthetase (NDP forming)
MMISTSQAQQFLAHRRLAVVGASDAAGNFGGAVYEELRKRGRNPVAVNPAADTVRGEPCYPDLAAVPGDIDGAIVMVPRDRAATVVEQCAARGVPRVWLFRGITGQGAVSDAALAAAQEHGLEVVAGACPLMFLEPAAWVHRVHRTVRRTRGQVSKAGL